MGNPWKSFLLFPAIILTLSGRLVFAADPVHVSHTSLELIPEYLTVTPGRNFRVALLIDMDPGWHVYWRNPGDSGLAPHLDWKIPAYAAVGPVEWPYPERIENPPLTTYGYNGRTALFTPVTLRAAASGQADLPMTVNVQWLACKVECVPGEARFALNLPFADSPKPNPRFHVAAAPFLAKIPGTTSDWNVQASRQGSSLRLAVTPLKAAAMKIGSAQFFPFRDDILNHSAYPELLQPEDSRNVSLLLLPVASSFPKEGIPFVDGVLVLHAADGKEETVPPVALSIHVPVMTAGERPPAVPSASRAPGLNLWLALVFAFTGGVILNFLPCVLPVLSIKILRLAENARQNQQKLWQEEALFALGILVMFWALAGLILCLKTLGIQVGWGFQLQHPGVIAGLAVLFFCIVLYLWGFLEIGGGLASAAGALPVQKTRYGSFLFGLMTTVCATPCTAPFMGVALGYALVQPAYIALAVFTAMGSGMAAPYLVLASFPGLRRFIPKPGPWMLNLKIVVGFVLLGTIGKFIEILGSQAGLKAAVALFYLLWALGAGVWLRAQADKQKGRLFSGIITLLAAGLVCLAALPLFKAVSSTAGNSGEEIRNGAARKADGVPWEPFSEEAVEAALKSGRDVFINFTAAWCMTCQVNDAITFHNPAVVSALSSGAVIPFKADWTRSDEAVTRALKKYNRSSVPFYVLLTSGDFSSGRRAGVPFPEVLTPRTFLDILNGARKEHSAE